MSTASKHKQKTLVERAGWAVFWNTAFFPLKVLVGFLSGVVVVRLLRAEGFALYSLTVALLNFLGMFADLGIERTLPRFYPEVEMSSGRRGVLRLLGWVALVKGAVLLILLTALLIAPSLWIEQFQLGSLGNWLIIMIALLLVLGAASDVSIQLLYTHFEQRITNALDVLAGVVRPVLIAAFVLLAAALHLSGWDVVGAMLALLITTVVSVAISVWQSWKLLQRIPEEPHHRAGEVRLPSGRSLRNRLLSFAGLNYFLNWSVYLYDRDFVVLVMPFLLAPDRLKPQVAIISLAYKTGKEFLRALVVPLTGVQTPLFARLYAENRIEGLRTAYATITKFLMLVIFPAGVGLIVTARNFYQLVYGQIGRDAVVNPDTLPVVVTCTVVLVLGLFGESMISVALNVLMVYEEFRAVMLARLVALVSIPLLVWLVPEMGALGAAIAVSVAALASRLTGLMYALRRLGLPFPGRFFVKVGTASLVMGFALLPLLLLPPTIPTTLLMVVGGVGVFLGAFKLLGGMDRADKERFLSLRIPLASTALRFL
jgi:O-antigen/teichoic acid export membrane protein